MDADADGEVITFYSYKGGVGRSMCLANVAVALAQGGRRVLAVDCDFEAPGLHRYFRGPPDGAAKKGAIEFFRDLGRTIPVVEETRSAAPTVSDPQRYSGVIQQLLDSGEYGYRVPIANPNGDGKTPAALTLLPAGLFDNGYSDQVRSFDWGGLYSRFPSLFPVLAREWGRRYDYVLVDSRTGLTDVGSICTVMMPEKLVLVFAPNEQSINGALEVGRQAVEHRARQRHDLRPLPLFPLLSRVENAEQELQREWTDKAQRRFEDVFREIYDLDACDLSRYFAAIQVPHRSYYAYGERIATEEQKALELNSLAAAFRHVTTALTCDNALTAAENLSAALLPSGDELEQRRLLVEAQHRARELEQALAASTRVAADLERRAARRSWLWKTSVAMLLAVPLMVMLLMTLRKRSWTVQPPSAAHDSSWSTRLLSQALLNVHKDPALAALLLLELKGQPAPPAGLPVARLIAAQRIPLAVWPNDHSDASFCGPEYVILWDRSGPRLAPANGRGTLGPLKLPRDEALSTARVLFCSADGKMVAAAPIGPKGDTVVWRAGGHGTMFRTTGAWNDLWVAPTGDMVFLRSQDEHSFTVAVGKNVFQTPEANDGIPIDRNRVILTDDRAVSLFDVKRGQVVATQDISVTGFCVSDREAVGYGESGLWRWNVDDIDARRFKGRLLADEPVRYAVVSKAGIAFIRANENGEISFLARDESGRYSSYHSIQVPSMGQLLSVLFADDGRILVASGDEGVLLYSMAKQTWSSIPVALPTTKTKVAVSGRLMAVADSHGVTIWPLEEPQSTQNTWDAVLEQIGSQISMCLTSDQRVQYLAETQTAARDNNAACERRFGRTPPAL